MAETIPFIDLRSTHADFIQGYLKELENLFQTCDFIGASSKRVAAFEEHFARYIGVKHALGVNSGTDALLLALDALGVGHGDEVILPAFGFIATADVIVRLGARPVFVDVQPDTFNVNPEAIEAAITERTKAIIPVHLFGQICDMDAIMAIAERHKLPVVEDVAQACGAATADGRRAGSIGTFGAFSFYPTKNIGAAGDAGIVTTNDDALAEKIRRFRDHGRTTAGTFECIGYNSRLDTIQAMYLAHKLPELDDNLLDRIENAKLYDTLLAEVDRSLEIRHGERRPLIERPAVPGDLRHTFNLYTIKAPDRDRLKACLAQRGIQTAIYYPTPLHTTPALAFLGYKGGQFPVAEECARRCLSLPVWPGLKRQQIQRVVHEVREFLENNTFIG
ncbi:MAG: DegT/DnrJ/EryC1/StrS family aminotransferase [Candidatus Sumerlaeaceae bacterium]|nr:DegT/DnrJ/EryC1/StrS family aminotransferase [Candidatus Sumerlaeaceae bacterium]